MILANQLPSYLIGLEKYGIVSPRSRNLILLYIGFETGIAFRIWLTLGGPNRPRYIEVDEDVSHFGKDAFDKCKVELIGRKKVRPFQVDADFAYQRQPPITKSNPQLFQVRNTVQDDRRSSQHSVDDLWSCDKLLRHSKYR